MSDACLVSACLLGIRCRYDGKDALRPDLASALAGRTPVPVCPEQLGGLATPRPAAQLRGGEGGDVLDGRATVRTDAGADVTDAFRRGAEEVLKIAALHGATEAFLKARSPSCGAGRVWRDGAVGDGDGVTAAALKRAGIRVTSVE